MDTEEVSENVNGDTLSPEQSDLNIVNIPELETVTLNQIVNILVDVPTSTSESQPIQTCSAPHLDTVLVKDSDGNYNYMLLVDETNTANSDTVKDLLNKEGFN
jgi:hypothetical protein